MGLFNRHSMITAMGGNPQYYANTPSSTPAIDSKVPQLSKRDGAEGEINAIRIPETVTTGFNDNEPHDFHLSYGYREQPDIGGALNYAYENYGLPLSDVCGAWMVAKWPIPPIGSRPLGFYQLAPETSIGGLIPGQVISQPLLNPMDLGSGYDIYD